jgi:hypothetical protein
MADDKIVKVKMEEGGYDGVHGKFRAGGVYEFPQEQAIRYVRAGIAKAAPASAKTAREEDRQAYLADSKVRLKREEEEAEMAAAWDIDVRDVARAEFEAEAAREAAEKAEDRLALASKLRDHPPKPALTGEPGPVNTGLPPRPDADEAPKAKR